MRKFLDDNFLLLLGWTWLIIHVSSSFSDAVVEYYGLIISNVFFVGHYILSEIKKNNV